MDRIPRQWSTCDRPTVRRCGVVAPTLFVVAMVASMVAAAYVVSVVQNTVYEQTPVNYRTELGTVVSVGGGSFTMALPPLYFASFPVTDVTVAVGHVDNTKAFVCYYGDVTLGQPVPVNITTLRDGQVTYDWTVYC